MITSLLNTRGGRFGSPDRFGTRKFYIGTQAMEALDRRAAKIGEKGGYQENAVGYVNDALHVVAEILAKVRTWLTILAITALKHSLVASFRS